MSSLQTISAHECQLCGKKYDKPQGLGIHMAITHGVKGKYHDVKRARSRNKQVDGPSKCHACGQTFYSKRSRGQHWKHHPDCRKKHETGLSLLPQLAFNPTLDAPPAPKEKPSDTDISQQVNRTLQNIIASQQQTIRAQDQTIMELVQGLTL